ncbi:uncharacterized protein J7T54_004602 [Emericellopsis cladophorae]|uniref:Uncharacterized protein n=1 Tax=Emericellopsis cladophorae TaxID=2686198 RepID=A0A9Q0BGJ7_9HYPO|nr:uncharacterized protein J7T54_004602 [Emericellopsis cladophorae]KAI6784056.1 hypothetical protein J7T54_004602 [Emericellopsis cladophorae]
MCFGGGGEEQWWGYIDDGKGWTARPKSQYMSTPAYNSDLRRHEKAERRAALQQGYHMPKESKYTRRW